MSSIIASSQSIERISSNEYFVKFDIQTIVSPSIKFDLTINHEKPVNLIVSPQVYSALRADIFTRINKNTSDIKLFSYNSGKELCRIVPGSNKIGNVSYPEINFLLLSQIEFPTNLEPNAHYIIVIDSYPALNMIEYGPLKSKLFSQDVSNFLLKFDKFNEEAKKINTTVQLIISKQDFDSIDLGVRYFLKVPTNKLVKSLADIVFGCTIGGIQSDFSSIISKDSNWKIIDAFSYQKNLQDDTIKLPHKLIIRESGLVICGNTSSSIGLIIKSINQDSDVTNFKMIDINLDTQICDFIIDSNIPLHSEATKLLKYIEIIQYETILDILDTNSKLEKKSHMLSNSKIIESIEYSEFNDFALEYELHKKSINDKLCLIIKIIKSKWSEIRSTFICGSPDMLKNTFDLPKAIPITNRQYTTPNYIFN